jgi:hypothetical protein
MFDASLPQPSHALMQDRAFAAALVLCNAHPVTLPTGLVLLQRRIAGVRVLMLPRVMPPDDLAAQLEQAGLHRRPLILSPESSGPVHGAVRIMAPRSLMQLDLTLHEGARRAALHQKWRNQLGRAEQGGMRIMHRPLSVDHPLLALEGAQARRRRYRNWPTALTQAFAQVAQHQTHLFTAVLRGYPVAHMLFLSHGNRATYHIGHTTAAGRTHHAHNLVLWEAARALSERGITSIDLGPQTTPQIDRFKRRAGAQCIATGGTWLRWRPFALRQGQTD